MGRILAEPRSIWLPHTPGVTSYYASTQRKKTGGEKKYTPALTVPTVREIIAALLCRALDCGSPAYIERKNTRISQRNEIAYLYHWKSRNLLPPLRINQRK